MEVGGGGPREIGESLIPTERTDDRQGRGWGGDGEGNEMEEKRESKTNSDAFSIV